jgi:hypothetical protein
MKSANPILRQNKPACNSSFQHPSISRSQLSDDLAWFETHPNSYQRIRRALPEELPAALIVVWRAGDGAIIRTAVGL